MNSMRIPEYRAVMTELDKLSIQHARGHALAVAAQADGAGQVVTRTDATDDEVVEVLE